MIITITTKDGKTVQIKGIEQHPSYTYEDGGYGVSFIETVPSRLWIGYNNLMSQLAENGIDKDDIAGAEASFYVFRESEDGKPWRHDRWRGAEFIVKRI